MCSGHRRPDAGSGIRFSLSRPQIDVSRPARRATEANAVPQGTRADSAGFHMGKWWGRQIFGLCAWISHIALCRVIRVATQPSCRRSATRPGPDRVPIRASTGVQDGMKYRSKTSTPDRLAPTYFRFRCRMSPSIVIGSTAPKQAARSRCASNGPGIVSAPGLVRAKPSGA